MKIAAIFFLVIFTISFNVNSKSNINVFDAIKNNQIELAATSNGNHSGEAIILKINKLGRLSGIVIPAGTRFISENGEDQDLITVEEELIVLKNGSTEHIIKGFCVQQDNLSPSEGSSFYLAKEGNDQLIKLANYLDGKSIEDNIIQTAVWAVSDDMNVSGINNDEASVDALREYVCSITGKENVWYNSDPSYSIDANRNIVQEMTKVEGMLDYIVSNTGLLKMEICKENGDVHRTLNGGSPISRTGNYSFKFSLKVKGWESGNYSVQLRIGDKVIHKKEFVIV